MTPSNVLILSPNAIFREGLKRLLASDASLVLIGEATSLMEVKDITREADVDVVVVQQLGDQGAQADTISQLLAIPSERLQVVAVSLDETGMQIYHRKNVAQATVEGLISSLKEEGVKQD